MYHYILNEKEHNVDICIILNNWSNKTNINIYIRFLNYITSVLVLRKKLSLTVITTYPKLYVKSFQSSDPIQIYWELNKIMRNKSGSCGLNVIQESDQQIMMEKLNVKKYDFVIIFDDDALLLREQLSDLIKNTKVVYCTRNRRATLNQDVINILVRTSVDTSMYVDQNINKLLSDLSIIPKPHTIDKDNPCSHDMWDCECFLKNEKKDNIDAKLEVKPDVKPDIKPIDQDPVNHNPIIQNPGENLPIEKPPVDQNPIDSKPPDCCILNNTVYFEKFMTVHPDLKIQFESSKMIWDKVKNVSDDNTIHMLLRYMDCMISDVRYICTHDNFNTIFIDVIKSINSDLDLIDKMYKKNPRVIMMSNLIHHYVGQVVKKNQNYFFSIDENEPDDETIDTNSSDKDSSVIPNNNGDHAVYSQASAQDLKSMDMNLIQKSVSGAIGIDEQTAQIEHMTDIDSSDNGSDYSDPVTAQKYGLTADNCIAKGIKNALAKLNRFSAVHQGYGRRYNQKMMNPEKIEQLCKKISTITSSLGSDEIERIEQMYQDSVGSFDIYTTIITMSNWIEEIKDGNCIGINMNIHRGPYRKGRYDVCVLEVPLYVGSSIEMFETLRMNSSNNKKPIDINEHKLMDDGIMGKSNCIIPLYIHEAHWNLSREYLNPICNIILHDSLKIDNVSAWKLVYTVMIDMGGMMFDKTKRIKSIKYFFSLWLTTFIFSKEYCYDIGLNKFLTKIREYDEESVNISNVDEAFINKAIIERSNIDPSMIAGQIISTGYMVDVANLNFIKQLIIKMKFDEMKPGIISDDIYEQTEQKDPDAVEDPDKVQDPGKVQDMDKNGDKPKKIITKQLLSIMRSKLEVDLYRAMFLEIFVQMFKKKSSGNTLASNLKKTFGIPTEKLIAEMLAILDRTDIEKKFNELICSTKFNDIDVDTAFSNYSSENPHMNDKGTYAIKLDSSGPLVDPKIANKQNNQIDLIIDGLVGEEVIQNVRD